MVIDLITETEANYKNMKTIIDANVVILLWSKHKMLKGNLTIFLKIIYFIITSVDVLYLIYSFQVEFNKLPSLIMDVFTLLYGS